MEDDDQTVVMYVPIGQHLVWRREVPHQKFKENIDLIMQRVYALPEELVKYSVHIKFVPLHQTPLYIGDTFDGYPSSIWRNTYRWIIKGVDDHGKSNDTPENRDLCLRLYIEHTIQNEVLMRRVYGLRHRYLGCWCRKPVAYQARDCLCHGMALIALAEVAHEYASGQRRAPSATAVA